MASKKKNAPVKKRKDVQRAGDIHGADYNPRSISPEQLETLGKTMEAYGDISGIVFNIRTGNCVGGHQRLKQIDPEWPVQKRPATDKAGTVALGSISTPWGAFAYREVDWPAEKEKSANLAANKAGGEFDYDAVGLLLSDIKAADFDLGLTGFDAQEIEALLQTTADGNGGDDKQPGKTKELQPLKSVFELVVECESEEHQQQLFAKFQKQGLVCRVVTM